MFFILGENSKTGKTSVQGQITDYYKGKASHVADSDALLLDKLNTFFAHLEENTAPLTRATAAHGDCELLFSVVDVSKKCKRFSPRKAAGPDGIPSQVLRACADQLSGVFADIFNRSLSQSVVSTCFTMSTIVPVPKKVKVTEFKDNRRIALPSVVMKCFETLVFISPPTYPTP